MSKGDIAVCVWLIGCMGGLMAGFAVIIANAG